MLRLRQARHGVNGCIISGIVLGSLYGLMPLWLNHQGVSDPHRLLDGGYGQRRYSGQADRPYGRPLWALAGVARSGFVVILGCLAMLSGAAMAPALFILAHRASRCTRWQWHGPVRSRAPSAGRHEPRALLMSYTVGSLLGPTFTAMLMQNFSDNLLFIMIASVSFIYLADAAAKAGTIRRRWRTPDIVIIKGSVYRFPSAVFPTE